MIGQPEDIIQKYKASLMDNTVVLKQENIHSDIINIKHIYLNDSSEFKQDLTTGEDVKIRL